MDINEIYVLNYTLFSVLKIIYINYHIYVMRYKSQFDSGKVADPRVADLAVA